MPTRSFLDKLMGVPTDEWKSRRALDWWLTKEFPLLEPEVDWTAFEDAIEAVLDRGNEKADPWRKIQGMEALIRRCQDWEQHAVDQARENHVEVDDTCAQCGKPMNVAYIGEGGLAICGMCRQIRHGNYTPDVEARVLLEQEFRGKDGLGYMPPGVERVRMGRALAKAPAWRDPRNRRGMVRAFVVELHRDPNFSKIFGEESFDVDQTSGEIIRSVPDQSVFIRKHNCKHKNTERYIADHSKAVTYVCSDCGEKWVKRPGDSDHSSSPAMDIADGRPIMLGPNQHAVIIQPGEYVISHDHAFKVQQFRKARAQSRARKGLGSGYRTTDEQNHLMLNEMMKRATEYDDD